MSLHTSSNVLKLTVRGSMNISHSPSPQTLSAALPLKSLLNRLISKYASFPISLDEELSSCASDSSFKLSKSFKADSVPFKFTSSNWDGEINDASLKSPSPILSVFISLAKAPDNVIKRHTQASRINMEFFKLNM